MASRPRAQRSPESFNAATRSFRLGSPSGDNPLFNRCLQRRDLRWGGCDAAQSANGIPFSVAQDIVACGSFRTTGDQWNLTLAEGFVSPVPFKVNLNVQNGWVRFVASFRTCQLNCTLIGEAGAPIPLITPAFNGRIGDGLATAWTFLTVSTRFTYYFRLS